MENNDIFYRAFKALRDITKKDSILSRERSTLYQNSNISFEATRFEVTIEEDWINELDKGLEYVTKAIKEERQFIDEHGEITPIEKVKKVSKASVAHLAKHANLISKEFDSIDDIIPDKLYMVEKTSDYAIYENRVLYMILTYLKEFISIKSQSINKAINTYRHLLKVDTVIDTNERKLKYNLKLDEERYDNLIQIVDDKSKALIQLLNDEAILVESLLKTPLMIDVSKAPMVRQPITKTNVLRMNNNFKRSLELYEYIISYQNDGYKVVENVKTLNVKDKEKVDMIVELEALASFMGYTYGNELFNELEAAYEKYLKNKELEEETRLNNNALKLKKDLDLDGTDIYKYTALVLEDNKKLLDIKKDYIALQKKDEKLNNALQELKILNKELNEKNDANRILISKAREEFDEEIKRHELEIEELNLEHQNDIRELNNDHEKEKRIMQHDFDNKLKVANEAYLAKLDELEQKYLDREEELKLEHNQHVKHLTENFDTRITFLENKAKDSELTLLKKTDIFNEESEKLKNELSKSQENYKSDLEFLKKSIDDNELNYEKELERLKEQIQARDALLMANDIVSGKKVLENRTLSKEEFIDLEEKFNAFKKLFDAEWKKEKKQIKKQIFGKNK